MQQALFDIETVEYEPNPCIALYGHGPEGATCKGCALLLHRGRPGKRWYKCLKRRSSVDSRKMGAASTDHRLSWRACGLYREEEPVAR